MTAQELRLCHGAQPLPPRHVCILWHQQAEGSGKFDKQFSQKSIPGIMSALEISNIFQFTCLLVAADREGVATLVRSAP